MPLQSLRETLAADLAPLGVPVSASWPNAIVAPCAFVIPPLGDNYVVGGQTFGEYRMNVDLVLLVDHSTASEGLAALEALTELALANTVDWALAGVEPPAPITVTESGAEYLGTVMHLSKPFRL